MKPTQMLIIDKNRNTKYGFISILSKNTVLIQNFNGLNEMICEFTPKGLKFVNYVRTQEYIYKEGDMFLLQKTDFNILKKEIEK